MDRISPKRLKLAKERQTAQISVATSGHLGNVGLCLTFARHMVAIPFAAVVATSACNTRALAEDLPPPSEPWLAEPGDWAADFNEAQLACYNGSMSACDAIWLNNRVLLDSLLGQYGRTCGGRVDLRAIRRADLSCREAFPGHE